jgi:hypothetical protein
MLLFKVSSVDSFANINIKKKVSIASIEYAIFRYPRVECCFLNQFIANLGDDFNYMLLFRCLRENSHFVVCGDIQNLIITRNFNFVDNALFEFCNQWRDSVFVFLSERFPEPYLTTHLARIIERPIQLNRKDIKFTDILKLDPQFRFVVRGRNDRIFVSLRRTIVELNNNNKNIFKKSQHHQSIAEHTNQTSKPVDFSYNSFKLNDQIPSLSLFDSNTTSHQQEEKRPYRAIGTRPLTFSMYPNDMGDVVYKKLLKDMEIKNFFLNLFSELQLNLVLLAIEQFKEHGFMNVRDLIIFCGLYTNEFVNSTFSDVCSSLKAEHLSRILSVIKNL